jgi:hypothetical protein
MSKLINKDSIGNLREATSSFSLNGFLSHTVEVLMQIERDEYLSSAKISGVVNKGNGFYNRNFKSLLRCYLHHS